MIYEFVPQFAKMLEALSANLDKAAAFADAKKFEEANLLGARLAPDQFNFTRQVQISCDMAKSFVAKLTDKPAPVHEDKETSIAELKARVAATIHYLKSIRPEDFNGWETRKVTNPRREGKYLPGKEYALEQAIPNFFFHVTTAYSILRHNGLDIGKKDFLGALNYRPL